MLASKKKKTGASSKVAANDTYQSSFADDALDVMSIRSQPIRGLKALQGQPKVKNSDSVRSSDVGGFAPSPTFKKRTKSIGGSSNKSGSLYEASTHSFAQKGKLIPVIPAPLKPKFESPKKTLPKRKSVSNLNPQRSKSARPSKKQKAKVDQSNFDT